MGRMKTILSIHLSFLIFIVLLLQTVFASCLTQQDIDILNANNQSYLIEMIERACEQEKINSVNSSLLQQKQELQDKINFVNASLVNRTLLEKEERLKDIENLNISLGKYINDTLSNYYTLEDAEKLEARVNYELSQKIDSSYLEEWADNFTEEVTKRKTELTDIFDEKYSSLQKNFLTMEQYENHSSSLKMDIYNMVNSQLSVWDRYAWYIFLSIVVLVLVLMGIVKLKPTIIKKPILKDFKVEKKTIEELTTKSDLKKKIDFIRDLKLKVVTNEELNKNQKIELLQKIDRDEIWDDDSLNKEIELIKQIEKKEEIPKKKTKVK